MWIKFNTNKPTSSGTYFVKLVNGSYGIADYDAMIHRQTWEVNTDAIRASMLDDSGYHTELDGDVDYWMEIPQL